MIYTITFTKASGAGNDFVLVDNMEGILSTDPARLASALCSRPFGVGADGLLLLEPSDRADFIMRYFNADGSYGGMCGNGGRCAARYAHLKGHTASTMIFEALDHLYEAEVVGLNVRLRMKDPSRMRAEEGLVVPAGRFSFYSVDTGAPHAVIVDDGVETSDVSTIGRQIRYHERFSPAGTNVDFIRLLPDGVQMRTYERGVERETLACGTGAVASALVAAVKNFCSSPVSVRVRSGEELLVHFTRDGGGFRDVILEGSAHMLFTGRLNYNEELASVSTAAD